ncbi:MAG TPA: hypothetical protein VLA82_01375 [Actinomycetota bacterium]|nr:hypothetical protein [Actinomycetota bacterium]
MTALDDMLHATPRNGPWIVEVLDRRTRRHISTSRSFASIEEAERFAAGAERAPNRCAEIHPARS